jgi:DNA-binding NarL/FixJ family response regulator
MASRGLANHAEVSEGVMRKARVYIVDDSRVIREWLGGLFADMPNVDVVGYAETATDAVAGIEAAQPDCVMLDMNLKAGTGLDVLHAVHPAHPDIVFIAMSNNEGLRFRELTLRAGACHFVDKATELGKARYVIDGLDLTRP